MSKQSSTNNRNGRSLVIYTAVIIVILVALFAVWQQSQDKPNASPPLISAPPVASQPLIGDRNASISIVEFGDYKCPSCKLWDETVWPRLKQNYIDLGKATFAYINTLFHDEESRLGALAGEAVLQLYPDRFWDFHKALFAAQPNRDHDSLWLNQNKVLEIAEQTIPEFDHDDFLQQLTADSTGSMVALDELLVAQSRVKATPTIMINDKVIADPFDYDEIAMAIDELLQVEAGP